MTTNNAPGALGAIISFPSHDSLRLRRWLGAALVDVAVTIGAPLAVLTAVPGWPGIAAAGAALVAVYLINAVALPGSTGRSIGSRLFGVALVDQETNRPAGARRVLAARVLTKVAAVIPFVGDFADSIGETAAGLWWVNAENIGTAPTPE